MNNWISVKEAKPPCSRNKSAPGIPVLIWPRNPERIVSGPEGYCYYGRRATGRPAFYLFGAEIHGVTYWQYLPNGPR